MRWLADGLPREHLRLDPAARDLAFRLASPDKIRASLAGVPGGGRADDTWEQRDLALRRYRTLLDSQLSPRDVLPALLREHLARAVLPRQDSERAAMQLARACALRTLATIQEA